MGVVAIPEFPQSRYGFAQTLPRLPGIHARHEAFIFVRICPAGDTHFQAAARDDVRHGRFAG